MIKELIKLATHLDSKGLAKEADYLDSIIKKIAGEEEYVITTETSELVGTFDYSRPKDRRFLPTPKGEGMGFSKNNVIPNKTKMVSKDKLPPQGE
jgi:hypothetical protein